MCGETREQFEQANQERLQDGLEGGDEGFKVGRRVVVRSFCLAPIEVAVVGQQPTDLLAADNPDDARKTPAQTHTELVGTGELGLLSPLSFCLCRIAPVACLEEGVNEPLDGGGRDVECQGREDEGRREPASTEFVADYIYEPGNLFKAEHDLSLVGQVTVVEELPALLGGFVAGLVALGIEVQGQEAAIGNRELRRLWLGWRVLGATFILGLFVLLASCGAGRLARAPARNATEFVVGGL